MKVFCTICGQEVRGAHSAACNQPGQEFLTEAQLEGRRARWTMQSNVSLAEFRRQRAEAEAKAKAFREAHRENLRANGRKIWDQEGLGL